MITKISTSSRFLNKTIRVISSLVIALGMVFSSMPFVDFTVKAVGGTYLTINGCNPTIVTMPNNGYVLFNVARESRAVIFESSEKWQLFVVSDQAFQYRSTRGSALNPPTACSAPNTNARSIYYNGSLVAYQGSETLLKSLYSSITTDVPIVSVNTPADDILAYRYTYGDLSEEPGPDITYGNIKDLAYSTKISGGSIDQNHDVITWYPYWDTNNNISINWNMEIRVVPGTYTSDTQNGLFALDPQNFVTNLGESVYVYQGAYSQGSIEVSWLRIKELLTPLQFATSGLFSFFDGEYWTKKGWMYQARYIDPDNEYTSEWQNIYTVTSSSGKGVEDVIDPSTGTNLPDFYQNVNDSYNQIFNTTSTVNNNYNQVFYVNSAPYVVNPSEEPEEPDSNTDRILEDILRVTIQIRQLIQQDQNDGDEKDPEDTGLNDKDKELHDKEKELIDDMDDKLNDIDTDVDLLDTNGFLAAANWVRLQYDHLTLNTPFELVIVFALVLGIGLIFIGKVR